jgi:ureidoglycolate lyase
MAPKISASNRLIHAELLTPPAFAPFGEVVQNPATHDGEPAQVKKAVANQGTATKWLDVTGMKGSYELGASKRAASVSVNVFVCQPRQLEEREGGKSVFPVKILERHPFTPQMFVPMGLDGKDKATYYLVIVAPTLPLTSRKAREGGREPAYPLPPPRRKRSLGERLLGGRPNPFTNDFSPSTTPAAISNDRKPKGPGLPDLENVKAFIARGDQAVAYGAGTWHAPMVVLGERAIDFVVVQYANGVAIEDCQEVEIEPAVGEKDGLAADVSSVRNAQNDTLKAKL